MTIQQLVVVNEMMWEHKAAVVNEVVGPILDALGFKYRKPEVGEKKSKMTDEQAAIQKELAMLHGLAHAGLPIRDVK